jgi:hypothetical protein
VRAAVRNVRHKRAGLLEALQEAEAAVNGSSAAALGELQAAIEKPDQRRRLRARLRQLVPEVWAVFLRHGALRIAVAQLFFADGAVRSLLITYRPPVRGGKNQCMDRSPKYNSVAFKADRGGRYDLRRSWDWVKKPLAALGLL